MPDKSIKTVYLHGYSGDATGLKPVGKALSFENSIFLNLPGFGGSDDPSLETQDDIVAYAKLVWGMIQKHTHGGNVRLVGHSHGAMLAFTLAHLFAKQVDSVILLCPVAVPQWPAKVFVKGLVNLSKLVSPQMVVSIMARPILVDAVTLYSQRKNWSDETKQLIKSTRRREARHYKAAMINMFKQTIEFQTVMSEAAVSQNVIICYAVDDNVAGKRDVNWYAARCNNTPTILKIHGGHLAVVAHPAAISQAVAPFIK